MAEGGKAFIPAGTYYVTATINIPSNAWIEGAGKNATILELADGVNGSVLQSLMTSNIKISSLRINANDAGIRVPIFMVSIFMMPRGSGGRCIYL